MENGSVELLTLPAGRCSFSGCFKVLLADYRIDISICNIRCKYFLPVCHLSFYLACGVLA